MRPVYTGSGARGFNGDSIQSQTAVCGSATSNLSIKTNFFCFFPPLLFLLDVYSESYFYVSRPPSTSSGHKNIWVGFHCVCAGHEKRMFLRLVNFFKSVDEI